MLIILVKMKLNSLMIDVTFDEDQRFFAKRVPIDTFPKLR